ncbi:MAG: orotidine-5'-phosphate decarboxylase [Bacteroidales bacterium]|jgi:orotidine-5'-phosphate decarboxylase|nr:orotidine-5'-phosphate decarboxylase [Bacteroidales bacterium]MCK9447459.1 orotidine-5'-phosphate decarboxylase [Bacteroidales bacterium]MDD3700667.1 orotidine-5'-phosphate decarboxylase [Bacteroidales bacterium]MDY0368210.1 orotidine-5'-phosphate decarboxylase [Bacteroidales bacterium]
MNRNQLFEQIIEKKSFLCIGLDTDYSMLPKVVLSSDDPVFEFNKAIITATAPYAVAFKINTAFYESEGLKGWQSMEKTMRFIKSNYTNLLLIADAKRADIGNTAARYASAFFEQLNADALTVAPYMGHDSIQPFLNYTNKWTVLLTLTSNTGSSDFQTITDVEGQAVYQHVITKAVQWATADQLMFVVGATHPEEVAVVRAMAPEYFFLVPGIGAQGGSLEKVAQAGLNAQCGLLVNSSRGIIYASTDANFAKNAAEKAREIQLSMEAILRKSNILPIT